MAAGFLMVVTVGTSLPGPKPPFWETPESLCLLSGGRG
jgi:hypothetical protein